MVVTISQGLSCRPDKRGWGEATRSTLWLLVGAALVLASCGSPSTPTLGSSRQGVQENQDVQGLVFYTLDASGRLSRHTGTVDDVLSGASDPSYKIVSTTRSQAPDRLPYVVTKSLNSSDCSYDIRKLEATGTLSKPLAQGVAPAPSTDGRHLAFLRVGALNPEDHGCSGQTLTVLDLQSGSQRQWSATFIAESGTHTTGQVVTPIQWSPDSSHVVFGTYDAVLYSLDTTNPMLKSIRDAQVLRPRRPGWQVPLWDTARNALYVTDTGAQADGRESPLLEVDPSSGQDARTVLSSVGHAVPVDIDPGTGDVVFFEPGKAITDDATIEVLRDGQLHPVSQGRFIAAV